MLPGSGEEARDVVEAKRARGAPRWGLVVPLAGRSVAAIVLVLCVSLFFVFMRGAFPSALNEEEMS